MKPEIRFKGFEEEWKETTIGNIADVIGGGTPSTSIDEYWNGDIQWFTPTEVGKNKYVGKSARTISEEGLKKSAAKLLPKGTLLLSSRATIGEVSIAETECCTNQGFQSLIVKNIDRDFLYSVILTKKEEMKRIASGSTFLEISANKLRAIPLYIPSKCEQQEVGRYFGYIDEQISSASSRLTSLRQVKEASLQTMFPQEGENVPRVRFKGFEGVWKKVTAGEVFKTTNERNCPNLPVLSATQDKGMVKRSDIGYNIFHDTSNETTYKHILPGQFVIHLRSFQGGFAHSEIEGIASPAYTVMEFKNKEEQYDYFWKYIFMSKAFIKRLELITYGIRDGRSISFEEFKEMKFLVPTKSEQTAIASYFRSLDRQISLQSQRLEKLKQIKAACLDKMFV